MQDPPSDTEETFGDYKRKSFRVNHLENEAPEWMPRPIYGHVRHTGRTKENSQVEGIQACWELRVWIKTRPLDNNKMWNQLLTFPDLAHKALWVDCCLVVQERRERRRTKVVVSDLPFVVVVVVQGHNHLMRKKGEIHCTHTPNADEYTYAIIPTNFYPPSLFSRPWIIHGIVISWACVAYKFKSCICTPTARLTDIAHIEMGGNYCSSAFSKIYSQDDRGRRGRNAAKWNWTVLNI